MRPITITITDDAAEYLRSKVTKSRGHGAFVSAALLAMRAAEEARAAAQVLRQQGLSTKESWRGTGCNVD